MKILNIYMRVGHLLGLLLSAGLIYEYSSGFKNMLYTEGSGFTYAIGGIIAIMTSMFIYLAVSFNKRSKE